MLENKYKGGHSLCSPSGASRWSQCPASVRLTMDLPSSTNKMAERGTDIHQLGEMLLNGKEIIEATSVIRDGEYAEGMFYANRDMLEEAKAYYTYVHALATEPHAEIIAEAQVVCVEEHGVTGHVDATVVNGDTLHVVDLKTGRGPVSAENNLQMQLYALGVYDEYEMFNDFDKIVLHIVQDNDMIHNTNSWETTPDELEDFREWITERTRLALQEDSVCVPSPSACQWCGYADKCKALHDQAIDLITAGVDGMGDIEDNVVNVDEVDMNDVTALMLNKPLIDNLFKAYTARIETEMLAGNDVEGFKLIRGRKNKKWLDENEAFDKLKTWLPIDDVAPRKLCTPTQANKMLGGQVSPRKKNIFDTLYEVPEGELKAVPLSAKGESVTIGDITAKFDEADDEL